MRYIRSKLKAISREYTRRDRDEIIASAGGRCTMETCRLKPGEWFVFGPTNYLKQQIRFKVNMDIHVIDSSSVGRRLVVICSGCHLSYHLFNRLSEGADMGGKKLSDTLYKRCERCKELNCMCCKKCGKLPKWCACDKKKSRPAARRRRRQVAKVHGPNIKRLKLRSGRKDKR